MTAVTQNLWTSRGWVMMFCLIGVLGTGCRTGVPIVAQPIELASDPARLGAAEASDAMSDQPVWRMRQTDADDFEDEPNRLQILIGYGQVTSHVALRVNGANGKQVMWDPGGSYGLEPPVEGLVREADVITRGVPDVETYAAYRWTLRNRSLALGVFEYALTNDQTQRLLEALDPSAEGGEIVLDADGGFCGLSACKLLQETLPELGVPAQWWLPSTLVEYLVKHNPPRRIIELRRHQETGIVQWREGASVLE